MVYAFLDGSQNLLDGSLIFLDESLEVMDGSPKTGPSRRRWCVGIRYSVFGILRVRVGICR